MDTKHLPRELLNAVKNNQLILFVGAGLSCNLINAKGQRLGGWSDLVREILLHLKAEKYEVDPLLSLVGQYDPIDVLNLLEKNKALPKSVVADFLKEHLDLNESNDLSLHKKLFRLSSKIITTNYDTAFETAEPRLRKNKAYKGKNYELTKHKSAEAPLLFKLHGCYKDIDSMVLYPTGYQKLYNNPEKDAEHSLFVLKNIILNKTILFIGTGMGDFQINHLFQEIKRLQGEYQQKHFIISKTELDSSLQFLTRIPISDFTEIEPLIDSLIAIKQENEGNSDAHKRNKEMEEELRKSKAREKEFENKILSKDEELEKHALEYYQKGLSFSIREEYEKACENYDIASKFSSSNSDVFFEWGYSLGELAEQETGEQAKELYREACKKYKKVIEIKPDDYEAYYNWGTDLKAIAKLQTREQAEKVYQEAFKKFQMASEIKPDYHEVYNSWGNGLGKLANLQTGEQAEKLYQESFEKYKKAIEIQQDYHIAYYNWGIYLGKLAKLQTDEQAKELYQESFEKYQKAIEIQPDYYKSYYNWGTGLGKLANLQTGEQAEKLYEKAFEKYEKAIKIKQDYYNAYNNWGVDLGNLANLKTEEQAEKLYQEAFEKYEKAIEIHPNYHEAYYNWGCDLLKLSSIKTGKEANDFLDQAIEIAQKSVDFGGDAYNLACCYASKGEKKLALHYLKQCLEKKQISLSHVLEDTDWENYWEDKDFKAMVKEFERQ